MSISDELMWRYFKLLSFKNDKEIESLQRDQKEGQNPWDIKFILAEEIYRNFIDFSLSLNAIKTTLKNNPKHVRCRYVRHYILFFMSRASTAEFVNSIP